MLSLLRADLYRATRIRGFRGLFWQYSVVLLVISLLQVGLIWLGVSGTLDGMVDGLSITANFVGISPSGYIGFNMFTGYSILGFCASFGIIESLFHDLTSGFAKTMASSLRGRLAFFAEKVLFAGVWSALMAAVGFVLTLGSFFLVIMVPYGISFEAADTLGNFAMWTLCSWLAMWAVSVLPLAVALLTRNKLVTYGFMIMVLLGMTRQILWLLGVFLPGLAENPGILEPIGNALIALGSWLPSSVLEALHDGSHLMFQPLGMVGTGALPTWAWMMLTSVIWIALAGGAWLLVGKKRDL